METPLVTGRHPTILLASRAVLLVVDIQEKLMPAIHEGQQVIEETVRLIRGSRVLGVPVVGTEQYPKGLGPLVPAVRNLIDPEWIVTKTQFSACLADRVLELLNGLGRKQVVLAGTETHVCMLQTALDLLGHGYQVHVPVETTSSRRPESRKAALDRMRQAGAVVTTVESALFEMLERAGTPTFKEILNLVK